MELSDITLLENGLIEVKLSSDPHIWYEAFLIDVTDDQNDKNYDYGDHSKLPNNSIIAKVVMAIKDETPSTIISQRKHVFYCSLDQIRFRPKTFDRITFVENSIIEVKNEDDKKFISWKIAKIKKVKNTDAVVEYIDNDGQIIECHTFHKLVDVICSNDIRAPNPFKPLTIDQNPFVRVEFPIPDHLLIYDSAWLNDINFHAKLKKVENLINIYYNDKTKNLICLGFLKDQTEFTKDKFIKQCGLLSEWHFRALKKTYYLKSNVNGNICVLQVIVPKELTGLAIGKNGVNIQKARKMDGIKSIEFIDETKTFIIRGTSMKTCQDAASLLNFKKEIIKITDQQKDFVTKKLLMQEIVNKSGIFELQDKSKENCSGNVSRSELHIIGTESTIANFKMIFEYQFSEYVSINELQEKCQELIRKFKIINPNDLGSFGKRRFQNFADVLKS